jgi:predicted NBD/HSP70 family sugar kinase
MSRADVARQSGLSEGSISRITSQLIRREIICEDGAENSTGGRPGKRLRLGERHIGFGVEIRRNETRLVSATLSGRILETVKFETPASPDETLKQVIGAVRTFRDKYRKNSVEGLGVSVRGIVNNRTGVVESGNLPGWVGIPVRDSLQKALRLPVQVDNNVRLAAIAEYDYGNLLEVRNSSCLLYAMVDEGIGIGIVLDGKLYYGPGDAAGEFGQMVIADRETSGQADSSGILENLASSTALCEYYAALTKTRVFPRTSDNRARIRKICQLAIDGEAAALAALKKTCRYLGIGLANIIWGLNADAIVIEASINDAWSIVDPLIREQFPEGDDIVNFRNLVLRPSSIGGEASIIGAATLPFKDLVSSAEADQNDLRRPA